MDSTFFPVTLLLSKVNPSSFLLSVIDHSGLLLKVLMECKDRVPGGTANKHRVVDDHGL